MGREEALELARGSAKLNNITETDDHVWNVNRFTDGWLCTLAPRQPFSMTGGHCFVVLDDGSVHLETGSQDPSMFLPNYSSVEEPAIYYDDGIVTVQADGTTRFTPNQV